MEQEKGTIKSQFVREMLGEIKEPASLESMDKLIEFKAEFYGPPPHTIVIPATLHFAEEEYLISLAEIYKNTKNK